MKLAKISPELSGRLASKQGKRLASDESREFMTLI